MDQKLRIVGVVLPEGTQNPDNPVDQFTPQEMRDMQLTGCPIRIEHKDNTDVGEIVYDWVSSDGKKYIAADLRGSNPLEVLTQYRILNGALPDLSLTHQFDLYEGANGALFHDKKPIEVSLTREGRRAKCHIVDIIPDTSNKRRKLTDLYNSRGGLSNILLKSSVKMQANADSTQPIPVAVPAQPDAQAQQVLPQQTQVHQQQAPGPTPMQEDPIQKFNQIKKEDLLQETIMERNARMEAEKRYQQAMAEKQQLEAKLNEQEEKHRQKLTAEADAILQAALEMLNVPQSAEVQQSLNNIKACRDANALSSMTQLVSGLVSANKEQVKKVQDLEKQVEREKQTKLVNAYFSHKFAPLDSRFINPPQVQLPTQVEPAPTPMQTTPTNMQTNAQVAPVTPMQTTQTSVPLNSMNWSQQANPFLMQRASVPVQASYSHQPPTGIPAVLEQSQPVNVPSFQKMALYSQQTTTMARTDVPGMYRELHGMFVKSPN